MKYIYCYFKSIFHVGNPINFMLIQPHSVYYTVVGVYNNTMKAKLYSSWRLYQYNEDELSFYVLISNKLYTSKQREAVN